MSIVGVTLKDKKRGGREYTIVGEYDGGWVISPVEFDGTPNEHVTAAEIGARFGTEVDEPQPADEQAGWEALGERFAEAVDRQRRGEAEPPAPTPEQTLGEIVYAGPAARRVGVKK